jgi:hypothetical protein
MLEFGQSMPLLIRGGPIAWESIGVSVQPTPIIGSTALEGSRELASDLIGEMADSDLIGEMSPDTLDGRV